MRLSLSFLFVLVAAYALPCADEAFAADRDGAAKSLAAVGK